MLITILALSIFIITFILITTEKLPNAIAAMTGAFLIIILHILPQEEALHFVDFDTIGLLCGMMISVSVLKKTGLFEYIAIKGVKLTHGNPWKILVVLSLVTAVLSAFLDNVTTVLIIVPLTFAVADTIKVNPTPFLISEILFSNIGGTITLIGDPPNIMIGGQTHLGFTDFILNNLPVVIIISIVILFLLKLIYYKKLMQAVTSGTDIEKFDETRTIPNKKFFIISFSFFILIILSFITHDIHGISIAHLALGGGFIMMLITKQDPEEILKEIEWPTLFFFFGLFIIVGGLEKAHILNFIAEKLILITKGETLATSQIILWFSAFFSAFVDNIPYTATMIPVIKKIALTSNHNINSIWWALSLGACLGGNGTIIGASANIIVIGFSKKTPYPISFKDFFKIAFPLMIISIAISSVYLYVRYFAFN